MTPGKIISERKTKKGRNLIIRLPHKDDARGLMQLINGIINEDDYITINKKVTLKKEIEWLDKLLESINKKEKIMLIAEVDGKLVGNSEAGKGIGRSSHVSTFGISIIDGYREEGIGKIIAKEVIRAAKRELGSKIMTLDVIADNKRAISLYKKIGFKKIGILPKAHKRKNHYIDVLKMYKVL